MIIVDDVYKLAGLHRTSWFKGGTRTAMLQREAIDRNLPLGKAASSHNRPPCASTIVRLRGAQPESIGLARRQRLEQRCHEFLRHAGAVVSDRDMQKSRLADFRRQADGPASALPHEGIDRVGDQIMKYGLELAAVTERVGQAAVCGDAYRDPCLCVRELAAPAAASSNACSANGALAQGSAPY